MPSEVPTNINACPSTGSVPVAIKPVAPWRDQFRWQIDRFDHAKCWRGDSRWQIAWFDHAKPWNGGVTAW